MSYRLRPGHGQLAFTLALAIAGYVFLYWWVRNPEDAPLPVLFYLVQVLIIVAAIFTAAAFFLDRYRLPVPVVLVIAWGLFGLISHNDHFFAMLPAEKSTRSPPRLFDLAKTWEAKSYHKNALRFRKARIRNELWSSSARQEAGYRPRRGPPKFSRNCTRDMGSTSLDRCDSSAACREEALVRCFTWPTTPTSLIQRNRATPIRRQRLVASGHSRKRPALKPLAGGWPFTNFFPLCSPCAASCQACCVTAVRPWKIFGSPIGTRSLQPFHRAGAPQRHQK